MTRLCDQCMNPIGESGLKTQADNRGEPYRFCHIDCQDKWEAKHDYPKRGAISDAVNHPAHYNDGKIEVCLFIEDKKLGFHLGNAVKYIARCGKKDPAKDVEDLAKAQWYLDREIELRLAKREGREPCFPDNMDRRYFRDREVPSEPVELQWPVKKEDA